MKTVFFIITIIGILPLIPLGLSSCIVNDDWYDAPCLDSIGNGSYEQHEVDQWTEYYSYKGSEFMESKKIEMNNAINEERLLEWIEESIQNENVWSYYYYSGRAPNAYSFGANFEIISVSENDNFTKDFEKDDVRPLCEPIVDGICVQPKHDPYVDDESLRLAAEKKFLAEESMGEGSGMGILDSSNFGITMIIGIIIGVGSGFGLTYYWRKRK